MILPLLVSSLLCVPLQDDPALARPADAPRPSALHLSSFSSMRAARVGADGSVDSGSAVLTLRDGTTGKPLAADNLRYGKMPDLWASFSTKVDGADVEVRLLAVGVTRGGDERVKVMVRTAVTNHTDKPLSVKLAATLQPGGADAAQRPFPSLAWEAGSAFAQDGDFLTRDGHVLLGWKGTAPTVHVAPTAESADDEVATLAWTLEVAPNDARLIELALAGPPAKKTVDETAFVEGFKSGSYAQSEEQLGWQSGLRGHYADIHVHDARLWYALVTPLHQVRALGDADKEIRAFSDRPFGHPASDGAVEPELLGLFADWGWGDWTVTFQRKLLSEAVARGQGLSPERRVALVHGLSRGVRMGTNSDDIEMLAGAIRVLVDASCEAAPVRPWLDPEMVRADLQSVLDGATPLQGYTLPHFTWGQPKAGTHEAEFQAVRRAVSAHDGAEAWKLLAPLVASTGEDGFGSMTPGGVSDAAWSLALMSVMRDMLIDDHGDELHLFPAVGRGLIPDRGALEIPFLPTRYGPVKMEQFLVAKKLFGTQVIRMGSRQPQASLWHLPAGLEAQAVTGTAGGQATLRPDGAVDCIFDPAQPQGLRFNIKLTQPH